MNNDSTVTIYGTEYCPYCLAARMLLKKKGVTYTDILISGDDARRQEMERVSGGTTVPQIFVGRHLVGGFDELFNLDKSGALDDLLNASSSGETTDNQDH